MKKIIVFVLIILILGGILVAGINYKNGQKELNNSGNARDTDNASLDGSSLLTKSYTDSEFGYSIKLPPGYKIESEGRYSKLFLPDIPVVGVGPTNFLYISVVTPEMKKSEDKIYNYNPNHFNKLITLENIGESINLVEEDAQELGEWYTYTVVAIEDIDSGKVKNFQNNKPWEFPRGTTENKFIYGTAGNVYILGYYTGGDGVAEKAKIDPRIAYSIIRSFRTQR